MALTLDDALATASTPLPDGQYWSLTVFIFITQEDGRTAFSRSFSRVSLLGSGNFETGGRFENSGGDPIFFSDRNRFEGNPDRISTRLVRLSPSSLRLDFRRVTWNSGYSCDLSLPSNPASEGNLYTG